MTATELLAALAELAKEVPGGVALIGAFARNAWAPPRATTDLDLAVAADPEVVARVEAVLAPLGFRTVRRQQVEAADDVPDIVVLRRDEGDPRQVDLLVAKSAFEASALGRAVPIAIGDASIPTVTAEDLIVYKLLASRPRDLEDVRAVLATQERAGRALDWSYIERWAQFWGIEDRLVGLRE